MFCSRNKGAVRLCGAQADLHIVTTKVGVHASTDVWLIKRILRCHDHLKGFTLLFLNSQPLSGAILPEIKMCAFIYIPSMCMWAVKMLAISHGCAGSSEPSLLAYAIGTIISWTDLFHENKYVNIKFIKMQNRAKINFYLGACMFVCVYIIPVMHSLDLPCAISWGQQDTPRSVQQCVKMFHFEEFDVFDW